jgi:hypothetical protein
MPSAASARRGFANIDLNPKRPTTIAIRIAQREKQIASTEYSDPVMSIDFHYAKSSGRRGSPRDGGRGDPHGEAREDMTLRRYSRSTCSQLQAMVLEDFQIAN